MILIFYAKWDEHMTSDADKFDTLGYKYLFIWGTLFFGDRAGKYLIVFKSN